MATLLPSPTVTALRHDHRASPSGRLTAYRLSSLAGSLATSWGALDEASRADLVRRIQRAADDLVRRGPVDGSASSGDDRLRFLTARELQVLGAIADGASTSEIGTRLGLSTNTVRSYVKAILSKLGVHSRLEAVTVLLSGDAWAPSAGDDGLVASRS
jgi:DNA-binding NarL/FixJ family response regulator